MNLGGYAYSIIGVEILSVLVCLILLYGNLFEHHERRKRDRLFSYTLIACILALIADTFSWVFDGNAAIGPVLYVSTVISLIMTFLLDGIFIWYTTEYVREKKPVSSFLPHILMILFFIAAGLVVASFKSGWVFYFENGVYHEGPYYALYLIVNLLCSILGLITNMVNSSSLSVHDRIATASYIVLPFIAGCINLFFESFSYAYPAIVLSMVLMYVMIQSERQDKLEAEGRISYYHARHDALTGLFNRLAYEERLFDLSCTEGTSGTIFTDVNGLKYANDNFGHDAGDLLLTNYAELLCRYFRKDDIFRISGDEFVILFANTDEEIFRTRIEKFLKALTSDKVPMASAGFTYGNSKDIHSLIKMAESEMYIEKEEFHRNHPEMGKR